MSADNLTPERGITTPDSADPTEAAGEPAGTNVRGADTLVGEVLASRYRVDHRLGAGGMGNVFAGFHLALQKRIAIKVIQPRYGSDLTIASRFSQEARAASAIGHEHIIQIIDFGQIENGPAYLVMEFLDGEDLEATVRREGALPWERVVHIAEQIARALAAAHSQGIVHRDIKPANCYRVSRDEDLDFIKVLDFGLAKVQIGDYRFASTMTRTGALLGTPGYIAPELYRGQDADHRVDIYALGALMHKLLTGALPPVVHGARVDTLLGVPAPAAFLSLLARALSDDPDERYPTAQALAKALQELARVKSAQVSNTLSARPRAEPTVRPTMAHARCRSYMVLVHSMRAPSDEEWSRYVAQVEVHSAAIQGFLVLSDGGGPTSNQRRTLKQMLERAGLSSRWAAVVSRDRLTRGIVIALNLFEPNIRAFRPDELEQALTHIRAGGPDRAALIAEVDWLRQQVAP